MARANRRFFVKCRNKRNQFRQSFVERLEVRQLMAYDVYEDDQFQLYFNYFPHYDSHGNYLNSIQIGDTSNLHGQLLYNNQPLNGQSVFTRSDLEGGALKFKPAPNYPFGTSTGLASFSYFVNAESWYYGDPARSFDFRVLNVNDAPINRDESKTIDEDSKRYFSSSDFYFEDGEGYFTGGYGGYGGGSGLAGLVIGSLPNPQFGALTYNNAPVTVGQVISAALLPYLAFQHIDYVDPTITTNTNPYSPYDVNADGMISDADALVLLNYLNSGVGTGYLDVNRDTLVNPTDALLVINELNTHGPGSIPVIGFKFALKDDGGLLNGGSDTSGMKVIGFRINPVNDAPVGANVSRAIPEDSAPYLFNANDFPYSDPLDRPSQPFGGVKVVSLPTVGGTLALGTQNVAAGQLIPVAQLGTLKFTPVANFAGVSPFTFKVYDNTYSEYFAGYGGSLGIDLVARTFAFNVTPVNDAPVLSGSNYSFPNASEDNPSQAISVAQILSGSGYSDIDAGALKGLGIVSTTGTGTWQYSASNGTTWTSFGSVSNLSTLLLKDGTLVRYLPAANQSGAYSFVYRAWDQTTTQVGSTDGNPQYAASTTTGGTSAFSTAVRTASITVTPVNDAPRLNNGAVVQLTTTLEDTPSTGKVVSSLLADAGYQDVDVGALRGLAVTGVTGQGQWTYSLDGFTWASFGAVTATNALLLSDVSQIRFSPTLNVNGSASFQFRAWDRTDNRTPSTAATPAYVASPATGGINAYSSEVATATLTITAVNDAPVPMNNAVSMPEDTSRPFALSDFSYTDVEGAPLQTVSVLVPSLGTIRKAGVVLAANTWQNITVGELALQQLVYQPAADGFGSPYVAIQFKVSDGDWSTSAATLNIYVTPVNDPPSVVNVQLQTLEDTVLYLTSQNLGYSDPDFQPMASVRIVSLPTAGVLNFGIGPVVFPNTEVSSVYFPYFRFIPAANGNGDPYASFTYQVSDGTTYSSVATATIRVLPVNDAPSSSNQVRTIQEDAPYTFSLADFPINDPADSPANALLNVEILLTPSAFDGRLLYNGNDLATVGANRMISAADITQGLLKFDPKANLNGSVLGLFTFRIYDNGGVANGGLNSDVARMFTFNIQPAFDPVVAINDSYSTTTGGLLNISVPGVLSNDLNPDGLPTSVVLDSTVARGTLTLNANGSFTYQADANIAGPVSFAYKVNYGSGFSNVAVANINVVANIAPIAVDDTFWGEEDFPRTVLAPGLLENDYDANGDPLTVTIVSQPTKGLLSNLYGGGFTYTPFANKNGTDTFTYRVSDNSASSNIATVTMNIAAAYDPPVAVLDYVSMSVNGTLDVPAPGLLANDINPDGLPLQVSLVQGTQGNAFVDVRNDGSFTYYLPGATLGSTGQFQYMIKDLTHPQITSKAWGFITYTRPNNPPVAVQDGPYSVEEGQTLTVAPPQDSLLTLDYDPDQGDVITAQVISTTQKGTLNVNPTTGYFTYTPNPGATGQDTFTYRAFDGLAYSNELITVTISIVPRNDPPIAVNDPRIADVSRYTTLEDTLLNIPANFGLLVNDIDPENQPLSVVNNYTQPVDSNGVVIGTVAITLGTGAVTFTPKPDYFGTGTFRYQVTDGTKTSNIATVSLVVTSVNDAPVSVSDAYTVDEQIQTTFSGNSGLLKNDFDIDSSTLTAVLVTAPQKGTLTLRPDGSFDYKSNPGATGTDTFTYQASDGQLFSNTSTVTITIQANRPPVAVDDSYLVTRGQQLVVTPRGVLSNDSDPDSIDSITAVRTALATGPNKGTLSFNADGSFTYTPNATASGVDAFTYQAVDSRGALSGLATVRIEIEVINQKPSSADVVKTILEDQVYVFSVSDIPFTDPDVGDALKAIRIDVPPTQGTLSLPAASGRKVVSAGETIPVASIPTLQYTPVPDGFGSPYSTFRFSVSDGLDFSSAPSKFTFNVTPVADAPLAVNDTYVALKVAGNSLTIDPSNGLLSNDSDVDSPVLSITQINGSSANSIPLSSGANITWNAQGGFTYSIPATGFNMLLTQDSFQYTVSDGTLSATGIVKIDLVQQADVSILPSDDGYVRSDLPYDNFGATGVLRVGTVNGAQHSALLKFDLTGMQGQITSARLNLKAANNPTQTATHTWKMSELTWDETVFRWVDQPVGFIAQGTSTQVVPGQVSLDVTQAINDAVAMGARTVTLSISHDGAFGIDYFDRLASPADQPKLTVSGGVKANARPVAPSVTTATISEAACAGTTIINATFTDADNEALRYKIASGDPNGLFAIEASTGRITLVQPNGLDAEVTPQINLVVSAQDGANALTLATITITVSDVNEPPLFGELGTLVANKQMAAGTVLGLIPVEDPDGSPVQLSIVSGNSGIFRIDVDGRLVVDQPQKLTAKIYDLTIEATDGALVSQGVVHVEGRSVGQPAAPTAPTLDVAVSHRQKITFYPAASFSNTSGSDNYLITVKNSAGSYIPVGGTLDLSKGKLTVNADGTFTYDPNDNLLTTATWTAITSAVTTTNGTVTRNFRYQLDEQPITFYVMSTDASRQLTADSKVLLSGPVAVKITNDLPTLRSNIQYDPLAQDVTSILLNAGPQFTIEATGTEGALATLDVNDILYDPDGDPITITQLRHNNSVGTSSVTSQIAPLFSGSLFSLDIPEKTLTVSKIGSSTLQFSHDLLDSDIDKYTSNTCPTQLNACYQWGTIVTSHLIVVQYSDGTLQSGNPLANYLTVPVDFWSSTPMPNEFTSGSSFLKRPTGEEPKFVNHIQPVVPSSTATISPGQWSIDARDIAADLKNAQFEDVGGALLDRRTGRLVVHHDVAFDESGGNSEGAPTGFIYDSATSGMAPVIQVSVQRRIGTSKPISIQGKLHLFDHRSGDLAVPTVDDASLVTNFSVNPTSLGTWFDSENEFTFAFRVAQAPKTTGLYNWRLDMTMTFAGGEAYTWQTLGESAYISTRPVEVTDLPPDSRNIVADRPDFGVGWQLNNFPTFTLDKKALSQSWGLVELDGTSRMMVSFPGDAPRLFTGAVGGNYHISENENFTPLNLIGGWTATQEFGTLRYRDVPPGQPITGEFVYTDERGTAYAFTRFNPQTELGENAPRFLLTRIKPQSSPAITIQRQTTHDDPFSFSESRYGSIVSITFADGSQATVSQWDNGTVKTMTLPGGFMQSREVTLVHGADRSVSSIEQINFDPSGGFSGSTFLTTSDRIRRFVYNTAGLMTQANWMVNNNPTLVERSMQFGYDNENWLNSVQSGLSVQAGNTTPPIKFDVTNALRSIFSSNLTSVTPLSLHSALASVRQTTDYRFYDPANPTTGTLITGQNIVETYFSQDGMPVLVQSYFSAAGQKTNQHRIEKRYDAFGSEQVAVERDSLLSYDANGLFKAGRQLEDEVGRNWYYSYYDYQNPLTYATADEDTGAGTTLALGTDATAKYDPTDFRANPTAMLSVNGRSSVEYETDNELGYFRGLPFAAISAAGLRTETLFDSKGRMTRRQTIRGGKDSGVTAVSVQDQIDVWTYYPDDTSTAANLLRDHIDSLGLTTSVTYDSRRRTQLVTVADTYTTASAPRDDQRTRYNYDDFGNVSRIENGKAQGATSLVVASTTENRYDAIGFVRETIVRSDGSNYVDSYQQFDYDADGLLTELRRYNSENVFGFPTEVLISKSTTDYDSRGLAIQQTEGLPTLISAVYDGVGRAALQTTSHQYYLDGTLKSTTSPTKLVDRNGTSTDIVTYQFKDPTKRQSWTVQTGVAGTSTIDVNRDVTTSYVNSVATVKLDSWARVLSEENLLTGERTQYEYGDYRFDQPTLTKALKNFGSSSITLPVQWSASDTIAHVGYEQRGLVVRADTLQSDVAATKSLTGLAAPTQTDYDEFGYPLRSYTLATAFSNSGGIGFKPQFSFETDPMGHVVKSTETRVANGQADKTFESTFVYDQQGRLRVRNLAIDPGTGTAVRRQTTTFDFDAAGSLQGTHPIVTERTDGAVTTQGFDGLGRVVVSRNALGGITATRYDAAGRVSDVEFIPSDSATARQTKYTYDALDRVLRVDRLEFGSPYSSDQFDYFDNQYWTTIAYLNVPSTLSGDALKLHGAKSKLDAMGHIILSQQPYAGTLAEYNAASAVRDTGISLTSYEYFASQQLSAVTSRLSVGPFNSTATFSPNAGAKVSLSYADTRINRTVANSDGDTLMQMERLVNRNLTDVAGAVDNLTNPDFRVSARRVVDESGRLNLQIDAKDNRTLYAYDDSLTGSGGISQIHTTSGNSVVSSVLTQFDSRGDKLSQQSLKKQGAANQSTPVVWTYDGLGRPLTESTTVALRLDTNQLPVTQAVVRSWSYPTTLQTVYTDRSGNVQTSTTNPTARTQTTNYSKSGVTQNTLTQTLYSDGALSSVSDNWVASSDRGSISTSLNFDYDVLGLQTRESGTYTFGTRTLADTRVDRQSRPEGVTGDTSVSLTDHLFGSGISEEVVNTTVTLDGLNRISKLRQVAQTTPFLSSTPRAKSVDYSYLVDNAIASMGFAEENATGTSTAWSASTYGYAADGRLKQLDHLRSNAQVILSANSQVDSRGLITELTRSFGANSGFKGSDEKLAYRYDDQGQLVAIGQAANVNDPVVFSKVGAKDGSGNDATSVVGAGERQLSTPTERFTYDVEGNLVSRISTSSGRSIDNSSRGRATEGVKLRFDGPDLTSSGPNTVGGSQAILPTPGKVTVRFSAVEPGDYDVWASWDAVAGGDTSASYKVTSPSQATKTATVNFSTPPQAPNLLVQGSVRYKLLFTISVKSREDVTVVGSGNKIAFDSLLLTPSQNGTTYTWDQRHQLIQATVEDLAGHTVETANYGYDGLGRHVLSSSVKVDRFGGPATLKSTQHIYDGQMRVMDALVPGNAPISVDQLYFVGVGGQVLAVNSQLSGSTPTMGDTVWYYADTSGVVRVMAGPSTSDPTKEFRVRPNFDTFGDLRWVEGSLDRANLIAAPIVWKGQVLDRSTRLYDVSGQLYDGRTGRYTNEQSVGDNGYTAAGNNPLATMMVSDQVRDLATSNQQAREWGNAQPRKMGYEERKMLYGSGMVGTYNWAGSGIWRGIYGDDIIAGVDTWTEYGALWGATTAVGVATVYSGGAGMLIKAPVLVQAAIGGAVSGGVMYTSHQVGMSALDGTVLGRWHAPEITAQGLGTSMVAGAIAGPLFAGAGQLMRPLAQRGMAWVGSTAAGQLARVNAGIASLSSRFAMPRGAGLPQTDRLFVYLTPKQYNAVVSSGYLGKGYTGASKVLLPPIPYLREGFEEGRIWATAYTRDQLRGLLGAYRLISEGMTPIWFAGRTKTIEITGEAARAFTRPYGREYSHNVVGWLKGFSGTQQQFRGQLKYMGDDIITSLDGSITYTTRQMNVYRLGEWERMSLYGGTGVAYVGWKLSKT